MTGVLNDTFFVASKWRVGVSYIQWNYSELIMHIIGHQQLHHHYYHHHHLHHHHHPLTVSEYFLF